MGSAGAGAWRPWAQRAGADAAVTHPASGGRVGAQSYLAIVMSACTEPLSPPHSSSANTHSSSANTPTPKHPSQQQDAPDPDVRRAAEAAVLHLIAHPDEGVQANVWKLCCCSHLHHAARERKQQLQVQEAKQLQEQARRQQRLLAQQQHEQQQAADAKRRRRNQVKRELRKNASKGETAGGSSSSNSASASPAATAPPAAGGDAAGGDGRRERVEGPSDEMRKLLTKIEEGRQQVGG